MLYRELIAMEITIGKDIEITNGKIGFSFIKFWFIFSLLCNHCVYRPVCGQGKPVCRAGQEELSCIKKPHSKYTVWRKKNSLKKSTPVKGFGM